MVSETDAYYVRNAGSILRALLSCTYGNNMHKFIVTDNHRFEELKFDFVSHFNQKHLLNRSHQQNIIDMPIRRISRVLCGLYHRSLSLFPHEYVPKNSNMILMSQK